MSANSVNQWRSFAREWHHFSSPLRPCKEDLAFMTKAISSHCSHLDSARALLCGVTPEIAELRWPDGMYLSAVEQVPEMIECVWPGDLPRRRQVICGDWLNFPAQDGSYDVVIGDGCFTTTSYPNGHQALSNRIKQLLKVDGIAVMRLFIQANKKESVQQVFSDLYAGNCGSFHSFKWRLAMSLQEDALSGIRPDDIYAAWKRFGPNNQELSDFTGWPLPAIATIELYAGKQNPYAFPSLDMILRLLRQNFKILEIYKPQYELGERCPIVLFMPIGGKGMGLKV